MIIKFATLAPEGSTWMKTLRAWDKEIREKSDGRMRFRIYAGGVSGDEKDVVRKIRLGQLHAGGFTGVGLGEIAPEVRILDTPFLVESSEEADFLYRTFEKYWEDIFRKKGAILLGWSEVGFVYVLTKRPIQNLYDLKQTKFWMWEGDPIAEATFKSLGVNPIPLSVPDVMTSLQTGLIDGVYSPPLAAIALQWFTRTKYLYHFPLTNACGAVLISKTFYDKIPADLQSLLQTSAKKYLNELTRLSRLDNQSALETLKKNGIQILTVSDRSLTDQYRAAGRKARESLVGRVYSAELLSQVEKALAQHRSTLKR
ncbi:MAG: TRAP transporter substrate-binding protein DctP [Elusimicrobia bacterium]|nr:TRAP transporter substrate-binding protein DctP [Elusimicrobiota bacterium]